MKKMMVVVAMLLGLGLSQAAQNEAPAGFSALFNGKDLTGWYGWGTQDPRDLWAMTPEQLADYKKKSVEGGLTNKKGQPLNDHINAHWKVADGELINDGKGLYLTTDKDYGDFEFWVEYKALPDGDSGVYLRGIPQVQIWDATKGDPRGLGQDKGSGGLWNNSKGAPGKDPSKKMDKPFGEWNSFKITMIGERVTVVFNGETVVDNCVLENYFANKKAGYTAFGKPGQTNQPAASAKPPNGFMRDPVSPKGPIQLQTHGSEIRWRNVFIREIPPEEANARLAAGGEEGFVRLDNGKDLSNWQGAVANYEVKDGCIMCKKGKGGDLLSLEEYGDVLIRFEFKLPLAGNNGIALRTPKTGGSASQGLEIQVLDSDGYNAAHPKNPLLPYQYHGSLYHCVGAKHGYLRPVGQWNYEEIEVRGQKIKVTLNGTKILDVDIDTFDRSQIAHPPKGLDRLTGHIGFAGHSDPVAFRNFRVKRLD
jgi:hypothetical protein